MSQRTVGGTAGWHLTPTWGQLPSVPCKCILLTWDEKLVLYRSDGQLFELNWLTKEWRQLPTSVESSSSSSPAVTQSLARDFSSAAMLGSKLVLFGGRAGGTKGPILGDSLIVDIIPADLNALKRAFDRRKASGVSLETSGMLFRCLRGLSPRSWQAVQLAVTSAVPDARFGHSAVSVSPEKMLLFGGSDGTFCLSDVWEFDLPALEWKLLPPQSGSAPPPRMHHAAVVWEGDMFVFGGSKYRVLLNDLWQFRPEFQTWRAVSLGGAPPLAPHVRRGHTAVVLGEQMVVYGGHRKETGPTPSERCANDLWFWDFPTSRWSCAETKARWLPTTTSTSSSKATTPSTKPKPTASHGAVAAFLDGSSSLVVCGGERDDITTVTTAAAAASSSTGNCEVWVYTMAKESNSASCVVQ